MIFDTHAHYNIDPLMNDWQKHWQKAQTMGVTKTVVVGSTIEDSKVAVEISANEPNLYPAVGLHPETINIDQVENEDCQSQVETKVLQLNELVTKNRQQIIAIGEIGLDYYWLKTKNHQLLLKTKQLQQFLFKKQLQLAINQNLPIIIHCRDKKAPEEKTPGNAYWDLLDILQAPGIKPVQSHSDSGKNQAFNFVLHCASGPLQYIKEAISLGAYIGFDGNITYPSAENIRNIFQHTPVDRILIETDAPYLPPQQFRGQTCQPWMICLTRDYLENELQANTVIIYQNALNFYQLPHSSST